MASLVGAALMRAAPALAHRRTRATATRAGRQGQVYLVTGSTDGIGLHTAERLACAGATVLLHGRSKERLAAAAQRIRGTSGQAVQTFAADLSSLEQVRQLAAAVTDHVPSIHTLINNAGVYETSRSLSADGFETTWAVNVLASFLLTSLLLQSKAVSGSVVTTASISAASSIDFDDLQGEKGYSAHGAYARSKLCNIIFTKRLAALLRAAGSGVTTATLDPGTVNTKMLLAGWGRIGIDVSTANHTYDLATSEALRSASGEYYVGGRVARPPSVAEDAQLQERLWRIWEQQTGATFANL